MKRGAKYPIIQIWFREDAMYSGIGEVGKYQKCTNGAIFMGIKQIVLFIFQATCN